METKHLQVRELEGGPGAVTRAEHGLTRRPPWLQCGGCAGGRPGSRKELGPRIRPSSGTTAPVCPAFPPRCCWRLVIPGDVPNRPAGPRVDAVAARSHGNRHLVFRTTPPDALGCTVDRAPRVSRGPGRSQRRRRSRHTRPQPGTLLFAGRRPWLPLPSGREVKAPTAFFPSVLSFPCAGNPLQSFLKDTSPKRSHLPRRRLNSVAALTEVPTEEGFNDHLLAPNNHAHHVLLLGKLKNNGKYTVFKLCMCCRRRRREDEKPPPPSTSSQVGGGAV